MQASYGDLVRLDFPRLGPMVLVFDPRMAERVYRQEGAQPLRYLLSYCQTSHPTSLVRPAFHALAAAKRACGEAAGCQGVLTSNGRDWRGFRSKVWTQELD